MAQLAYVVRTYHADGFWCDGYAPDHLHTYDDATKRLFGEASGGKKIPKRFDPVHDPVSRQYLAWHEQYFVDLADRLRGAIRAENPDAVLFANYSANRTWYYPEMYMGEYPAAYCKAVDVSSVEFYWDVPGDALYQQFCCAFVQGVTDNRGGSVWIQPSEHGVSGVSSPVEIQLRGLEGAPWGIYPEFVESAGREEYFKQHVANVKAREEWWEESEPVPYVGIVASEQTRTLYAQGALPVYFSHTLGAFRAIFEKHWPVRILTEYDLENADLHGVRVLMLPDVACLSARAAEVVRRFVRGGRRARRQFRDVTLRREIRAAPRLRAVRRVARPLCGDASRATPQRQHLPHDRRRPSDRERPIDSSKTVNVVARRAGSAAGKGKPGLDRERGRSDAGCRRAGADDL